MAGNDNHENNWLQNNFDWIHCGLIMSALGSEGACAGAMIGLCYCGDLVKQGLICTATHANTYGFGGLFAGAALGAYAGYELSKYSQAREQEERERCEGLLKF